MKKIFILAMLFFVLFPVFSQGTIESVAEKGIVQAYKDLIDYKEVEVVSLEEETVVLPEKETVVLPENETVVLPENETVVLPENKSYELTVVEDVVEEKTEEKMDEPEREIRFPVDGVETPGITYLTDLFPLLAEEEVYEVSYSHSGVKLAGSFTFDSAIIITPRGIVPESVLSFISYFVETYPEYSNVTFQSEIDKLVLSYPEMTMDSVVAFASLLSSEAEKFIDSIFLSRSQSNASNAIAETVTEEEEVSVELEEESRFNSDEVVSIPLGGEKGGAFTYFDDIILSLTAEGRDIYEVNFGHNGVKTRGVFTNNGAVLLIPRGITGESIDSFALYLLENYPQMSEVYFSTDHDMLFITYPYKSMDEITAFCDLISSEAEKFIDTISLSRSQSSDAAITTTSGNIEDETVVVAPVEAPVAVTSKKKIFTFSAGFDLGMKGLFSADENAAKFFPRIGGDIRLSAWKFIFLEGRGDMMVYKNSSKLIIDGSLSALGGVSLMGSNFGVVAYGGVTYIFASGSSVFTNGLSYVYGVALEVEFASHIAIRAGYEHFADKNLYNVSVGYRF